MLNANLNIKRNNLLFASYICMRNSLICLIILFGIIAFPNYFSNTSSKISNIRSTQFYYSQDAISFLERESSVHNFEEALKHINLKNVTQSRQSLIIESLKFFVTISKVGEDILIIKIDSYINNE